MVGITLSPEDLRSAPIVVRRWIEALLGGALGLSDARDDSTVRAPGALSTATPEDVVRLFDLVRGDPLATQVLLEFGRERGRPAGPAGWLSFRLADLLAYSRVGDLQRLLGYLGAINRAFQEIRGDARAELFGFDEAGNCYLHESAHRQLAAIWQALLQGGGRPVIGTAPVVPPGSAMPEPISPEAPAPGAARAALFGAGHPA